MLTVHGGGTFQFIPDGQYDYLDAGETAVDSFTYTVADGQGGTDTATVDIRIDGRTNYDLSILAGVESMDRCGHSVSGAGDTNGDGLADLILGAPSVYDMTHGKSHVVFGTSAGLGPDFELSSLGGNNGFTIPGPETLKAFGTSVSSAGDINGDGFADLLASARGYYYGYGSESYVIFGKADGFEPTFDLSSLTGSNGFLVTKIDQAEGGRLSAVSDAGDINGDGFSDIIFGAGGANNDAGESYVIFGKADGFEPTFDLSSLDGDNGFVLAGIDANDRAGRAVSGAGDVNGDGLADLIIGASGASGGPDNAAAGPAKAM